MAALNYDPRGPYYGSLTTSGFYGFIVSALWHWTGDPGLVRPLLDPAIKALEWLDHYGDLDGDGFYEYRTRSVKGLKHQGWKDSSDAVVYEDGSEVAPPIAPCEEQAFAFAAKLHLSETLWWLDRKDEARRLYHDAMELKKRFNDAFWLDTEGCFAFGLDSRKRRIGSVASNADHCIAAGIADESLVPRTVERLFAEDLFSGWASEHCPRNTPLTTRTVTTADPSGPSKMARS